MRVCRRPAGLACALVLVLSVIALAPSGASSRPDARLVVMLFPEGSNGSPGNALVDQGIRSTFAASGERVDIFNEYLDVSRFSDKTQQRLLADYLRKKYAGRKVDVVIAGLSSGLDFALEFGAEVFAGAPVVFCAVDQREIQSRRLPPHVVGVPTRFDLTATLDLALRLHPTSRRVYVVAGKSRFDAGWEAEARHAFRAYEGHEFVYLTGLPMDELLEEVARLPEGSVIYYLNIFEDGAGKIMVPADALQRLAAVANAPIYGHVDTFVGRGLVGGRVFRFETAGEDAARVGLRLLAGERPEAIGVGKTAENSYQFDWRQLRRWGVSRERLPPGSVVRFEVRTFWDLYKWPLIGVGFLCVVESLLIAALLIQRASRRRAETRFRQVIEAAPTGMVLVSEGGVLVLANARTEELFGYTKGELLGRPVEVLVPGRFRERHHAHRARFFSAPEVRPMGPGRDLFGLRKDGSEFPVEISLSPVRIDGRLHTLASIIDVTERRRAEQIVRKSQQELRVLTGKLLKAEETERRRIARELHDDFNQTLALLSVELDLLGQHPPESTSEVGERMQELSDLVKQLSSSVHDLSHRLHPAKLEQLGLVAALRGLCKESPQGGLLIAFTHCEVPEPLTEDVALCLYRIAQEALRNVIKHSAARNVGVELTADAGAVYLRITDDGGGFDPRSVSAKGGLGLVSMRERLRLVGGEIAVESQPSGTRIEVRVPLPAPAGADHGLRERPVPIG